MDKMFCFQCEQTAKGTGCTASGVCGKKPEIARIQDELTCELVNLAQAMTAQGASDPNCVDIITDGLFATVTNVNFDADSLSAMLATARSKYADKRPTATLNADNLFQGDKNVVSLRSTLLFGVRGMAAYQHHARVLGQRDETVDSGLVRFMAALAGEHGVEEWLGLLMDFGKVNLACMALLDKANTEAYGNPTPVEVSLAVEPGPFIVVTGHDLLDLKMLLEQTEGKGVNVYTHSEMLPAHAYPELKKYPHLKGHFGTAWQNQQKEFDGLPAPILWTTNCLMPPKPSYMDRVYTSAVVSWPGAPHIASGADAKSGCWLGRLAKRLHISADADGKKDFTPIIEAAIRLGGYKERQERVGMNGGTTVTTGFGRKTVLDNAGAIIDAVKGGAIRHFFLVGGCDGAKPGRSYYTDFVKATPKDTVVLTLACGKFRFNDLDIGKIGPFPRILDMGQCNDAYGAVQVALALAGAFNCGVNELPLTLVLSWYEQKAVCILLTLLSLGIQNIWIGPSLPAFLSPDVLNVLVEKFQLHPITTPEADLQTILGDKA